VLQLKRFNSAEEINFRESIFHSELLTPGAIAAHYVCDGGVFMKTPGRVPGVYIKGFISSKKNPCVSE
jgi:hypothetical protein